MSLKKVISLILVLMLVLCALPLTAGAAQTAADVKALIDALPTLDAVKAMSQQEQQAVYTQTQAAYDTYLALSADDQAALEGSEEIFQSLFGYFNTLVMPLETQPEAEPEQKKEGIPWGVTAFILALITTFLQNKFIHGRKR